MQESKRLGVPDQHLLPKQGNILVYPHSLLELDLRFALLFIDVPSSTLFFPQGVPSYLLCNLLPFLFQDFLLLICMIHDIFSSNKQLAFHGLSKKKVEFIL